MVLEVRLFKAFMLGQRPLREMPGIGLASNRNLLILELQPGHVVRTKLRGDLELFYKATPYYSTLNYRLSKNS